MGGNANQLSILVSFQMQFGAKIDINNDIPTPADGICDL